MLCKQVHPKKISKIVKKFKISFIAAEELKKLERYVHVSNVTRWNSILFSIRSVIRIPITEYKQIQSVLPTGTQKQKEIKKAFDPKNIEREMLKELVELLEVFEWCTNELQTNQVSILRVFPCYIAIKKRLLEVI